MLNYNDIVNELNSYNTMELIKLYNSCSESEYQVYSYNDMAIIEFIENVVSMELIDFIGMVVMADTYSYDASRDNVFYKTDDDVIHVCGVKDIKVPFDGVINKAMTNKEFFKDIDFNFYIFLVEKDK